MCNSVIAAGGRTHCGAGLDGDWGHTEEQLSCITNNSLFMPVTKPYVKIQGSQS
jgi:hypothetical protein